MGFLIGTQLLDVAKVMVTVSRGAIMLETTHLANTIIKAKITQYGRVMSSAIANLKTLWLRKESAQDRNKWRKSIKQKQIQQQRMQRACARTRMLPRIMVLFVCF